LEIITYNHYITMFSGKHIHAFSLYQVRILVFINENMQELVLIFCKNIRMIFQEHQAIEKEVIKIHSV